MVVFYFVGKTRRWRRKVVVMFDLGQRSERRIIILTFRFREVGLRWRWTWGILVWAY